MRKSRWAAAILLLLSATSLAALSPQLGSRAGSWFESAFSVGWSPARGTALLGWRISFALDTPVGFGVSFLLDDRGGYAVFETTYFYNPSTAIDTMTVPLSAGIGLARDGTEVSPAFSVSGGAAWYPFSIPNAADGPWIVGFGAEMAATVYLVSWGIEPVLSTRLLLPANLSAGE